MRSALVWTSLAVTAALLLVRGGGVDAWNRQIFNRYSRNLYRGRVGGAGAGGGGPVDLRGVGGSAAGGLTADLSGGVAANGNNEFDEFNALFGLSGRGGLAAAVPPGRGMQQPPPQTQEVYGIVEPLIEDLPCVDRPCNANDDCCPAGVCVNTYGEGKCIYVYGRKRDLCHRNIDCMEPGMACMKTPTGNLMCQPTASLAGINQAMQLQRLLNGAAGGGGFGGVGGGDGNDAIGGMGMDVNAAANVAANAVGMRPAFEGGKQYGENCDTSRDCNVAKSMCCQLKRSHHHLVPKRVCAYFRDPFMCIDMMPNENEARENHFLATFKKRRI